MFGFTESVHIIMFNFHLDRCLHDTCCKSDHIVPLLLTRDFC